MAKPPTVTRKLRQPAKKTTKLSPAPRSVAAAKLIDVKHIGDEILDWSTVIDVQKAIQQNLHHYNYFYDQKDAFKWGYAWIKKNYSKADQEAYAACDEWRVNTTFGGLAKMHMDGAPFPERNMTWLKTRAQELIEAGRANLKAAESKSSGVKMPTVTIRGKIGDFIGNIEEAIDLYHDPKAPLDIKSYSVYSELKKINAPKSIAQATYNFYLPLYAEIEELVTKKTPDLVEAYKKNMPKIADQKKYMEFLKQLLDDCMSYMNAHAATKIRKPRARKAIPTEKLVEKMKYQKDSAEFKLTSVNPANIIGAGEVYLFNTKYRTLTRLIAETDAGLSVKGTTIVNIKEPVQKKTLRKPEDVIPQLQSTKARAGKVFDEIKTKAGAGAGRVNEETIILKVFK
jgi:hypothetical protein